MIYFIYISTFVCITVISLVNLIKKVESPKYKVNIKAYNHIAKALNEKNKTKLYIDKPEMVFTK